MERALAEEVSVKKQVTYVYSASQDVIEAVRKLILRTEQLGEQVLRDKLPESELSTEEMNGLDRGMKEMQEGAAITLEEFNKHQGFDRKSNSQVHGQSS